MRYGYFKIEPWLHVLSDIYSQYHCRGFKSRRRINFFPILKYFSKPVQYFWLIIIFKMLKIFLQFCVINTGVIHKRLERIILNCNSTLNRGAREFAILNISIICSAECVDEIALGAKITVAIFAKMYTFTAMNRN